MFGNFQRTCGAVIQTGIQQKPKFNLNKKIAPEDIEAWRKFTSSKETIENKDYYLDQKKNLHKKLEKLICMAYLQMRLIKKLKYLLINALWKALRRLQL